MCGQWGPVPATPWGAYHGTNRLRCQSDLANTKNRTGSRLPRPTGVIPEGWGRWLTQLGCV